MQLRQLAAQTPEARDRYVDFLRAFSIAAVVFGHWFIALIWWRDGRIGVYNAVGATSGLWLATWVLQVLPLFFFVGGFSNFKTYKAQSERGTGYRAFVGLRAQRLLTPALVFVAVWAAIQTALHALDLGGASLVRGSFLPFGPLWFLLVYLAVTALTPPMLALHERLRVWIPVTLAILVAVVDLLRFWPNVPAIGWFNLALVWLFAHQLGFFYADGSLPAAGRRAHVRMAIGGTLALILLTNINVYPRSMVGTDVEAVSNMNPPTLCIVALTLWLIGAAMLLRDRVNVWLAAERPWMGVIAANSRIMTVYLWHLTAYLLAILALYPLGLGRPSDSTASWWLQRPIWILIPAVFLGALVALFGRFERPRPFARSL